MACGDVCCGEKQICNPGKKFDSFGGGNGFAPGGRRTARSLRMGRGELSLTVALAVVASAALPLRVAAARPARASFGRGAVSELRSMWPASGDSRLARMRASLGLRPELDSMPGAAPPPRRKGVKEIEAEFVATHGPGTTVPTQFDAREQVRAAVVLTQLRSIRTRKPQTFTQRDTSHTAHASTLLYDCPQRRP